MSKISEWIKLAYKGLPNIDKIAEGIINDVKLAHNNLPEDEQEEIVRRRLICQQCPLNSLKARDSAEYYQLYGSHYEAKRTDLHCSICGCPVDTRTASLSANCGLEEYINNNNNEIKQELKWKKYEK